MKKVIVLLMAAIMTLALAACGGTGAAESAAQDAADATTSAAASVADAAASTADAAADAVVTGGNANEVIILPKLDKVIGTLDYINKIAGASAETLQDDGPLVVELQVITGATSETGFNTLSAR